MCGMVPEKQFKTFEEFWPHYLSEHSHPLNRALHFAGTTVALGCAALGLATMNPFMLPAALAAGYGPAWIGHFMVEKNRPATFTYPLWSFRGDFKMYALTWRRRIGRELAAFGIA
jgi:hypothetical protein